MAVCSSWGTAILLALATLITPAVEAGPDVRGVTPDLLPRYSIPSDADFECLDGRGSVPASRINDEYCDCTDGSDEPGTSACPGGSFYCANVGFEPRTLKAALVDDGVCDCCDGSDEPVGSCANTCQARGLARKAELAERLHAARAGLQRRAQYVQEAASKLTGWKAELARLRDDLSRQEVEQNAAEALRDSLQAKEDELKAAAEAAEKAPASGGDTNKEHQGSTGTPDADQAAPEAISADEVVAADQVHEHVLLPEEMAEAQGDGTAQPETQTDKDMAAAAAAVSVPPGVLGRAKTALADVWSAALSLLPGSRSRSAPAVPKSKVSDAVLAQLKADLDAAKSPLSHARTTASAAATAVRETKKAIAELETKLENIGKGAYGEDSAWAALDGRCFSAQVDKYTYELCPFGAAKQVEGSGGGTNLGRWEGLLDDGARLAFQRGQQCWNGPARSLQATTLCGPTERLFDVSEPSRCEYAARFETPAACRAVDVAALERELARYGGAPVHEEL
ncbi:GLC2B [Auxenochlorella protothecoides x Auxenochlorella symbiontica]